MVRNLIAHFAELPAGVDPCGERGEFHAFCYRWPEFRSDVSVTACEVLELDGAEGLPTTTDRCAKRLTFAEHQPGLGEERTDQLGPLTQTTDRKV